MGAARGQGTTYPFSPLLMNFCTSFTPRRICFCLVAARDPRREGLSETRSVWGRTAPPPRPGPCPPPRHQTFPDALEELSRELAGRERLRDGVQEFELLPVRELRCRLRLGRRLQLLPRHGRSGPLPLPGHEPRRAQETRPGERHQPIGNSSGLDGQLRWPMAKRRLNHPGHAVPSPGPNPSSSSGPTPSPTSGPLPVPIPAPVSGRPGQASTEAFIGCGQCR